MFHLQTPAAIHHSSLTKLQINDNFFCKFVFYFYFFCQQHNKLI
ncbi:unnamed protein product [Brassica rapa subsp. trilocularis]